MSDQPFKRRVATLDPDILAFRDAESDAARAMVLLSAPVWTLMGLQSHSPRAAR